MRITFFILFFEKFFIVDSKAGEIECHIGCGVTVSLP
jgi:hypothetical protein